MSKRIFIFIFFSIFISSCSRHTYRSDGPPNFYVDETKIPNAIPKPESLARYGNMPSYKVGGTRYYTMKACSDYEAMGIASWYGSKFHKHSTSSGEPYNMLSMTAAHKTLPLPTYVEVTNLQNNKKIIVKVNDRGPFAANRIIDLSYVAAKKLGMLGRGTAPVRVKAINPYIFAKAEKLRLNPPTIKSAQILAYHQTKANSPLKSSSVYLQVGAFKNQLNAERFKHKIVSLLKTSVQITRPQKNIFRVQVGPFKDAYSANQMTHRLKRLGIKVKTKM